MLTALAYASLQHERERTGPRAPTLPVVLAEIGQFRFIAFGFPKNRSQSSGGEEADAITTQVHPEQPGDPRGGKQD